MKLNDNIDSKNELSTQEIVDKILEVSFKFDKINNIKQYFVSSKLYDIFATDPKGVKNTDNNCINYNNIQIIKEPHLIEDDPGIYTFIDKRIICLGVIEF